MPDPRRVALRSKFAALPPAGDYITLWATRTGCYLRLSPNEYGLLCRVAAADGALVDLGLNNAGIASLEGLASDGFVAIWDPRRGLPGRIPFIDGFELQASLFPHLLGQLPFERFCRAGVLIETCNVVELALDVPAGRRPQDRVDPLVDLVSSRLPEHADLATAKANLPTAEVEWARGLRNTIAAHIDQYASLNVLLDQLDKVNLDRLQALWSFVDKALAAASNHPASVLALLGIRGVELQGLTRVDAPPYRTHYGS